MWLNSPRTAYCRMVGACPLPDPSSKELNLIFVSLNEYLSVFLDFSFTICISLSDIRCVWVLLITYPARKVLMFVEKFMYRKKITGCLLVCLFLIQWFWSAGFASEITKIGAANNFSRGISSDGTTVIGFSAGTSFFWKDNSLVGLPTGFFSDARGINFDGTVIVGDAGYPFRWTDRKSVV